MSVWDKAKAKAEELYGRAERLYGESHGDPAATAAGAAHEMEGEAELEAEEGAGRPGARETSRRPDDEGLSGQGAVR